MAISFPLLAQRLGTWAEIIHPLFLKGEFDRIYGFLKEEKERGKRIAPLSSDVYRAFIKTPVDELKVVILGLCPYHSEKDGECVADGLALSCSKTGVLQPSLEKLWEAWEEEFKEGLCLPCSKEPDLTYLAEQGVLLLNAALTVEIGKAKSHNSVWKTFTGYVMSYIGTLDVPVIFLGNEASEFGWCIEKEENKFFLKHPAWASYKKCKYDSEGAFGLVNDILLRKRIEPIEWLNEAPF